LLEFPIQTPAAEHSLRQSLARTLGEPTKAGLRGFDIIVWFMSTRDDWPKVKEHDVMRGIRHVVRPHQRTVNQVVGIPFKRFRAAIVVRMALLRLAHTTEDVRQMAYGLGYSHESAMNHHFQQVTGVPPCGFRKLVWGVEGDGVQLSSAGRRRPA
jgi:hypothetical protein